MLATDERQRAKVRVSPHLKATKIEEVPKVKPETLKAIIKVKDAERAFVEEASQWHRASIRMVAAGTMAIIVALYQENTRDMDATLDVLRDKVADTGVKEAQIYRYVGLSKALVQHIATQFAVGGPVVEVLRARKPEDAIVAVLHYLETKRVRSLDALGVMVGKYARSDRTAVGPEEVTALPETDAPSISPSRSTPEAVAARIVSEPEVLNSLPTESLVSSFLKAGNSAVDLAEEAIDFIRTMRELDRVEKAITVKRKSLAKEKAKAA